MMGSSGSVYTGDEVVRLTDAEERRPSRGWLEEVLQINAENCHTDRSVPYECLLLCEVNVC